MIVETYIISNGFNRSEIFGYWISVVLDYTPDNQEGDTMSTLIL